MRVLILLLCLLLSFGMMAEDRMATTDEGERIVVHEDGTWSPADKTSGEEEPKRVKAFLAVDFGTDKSAIKDIQGFSLVQQTDTFWAYEGFYGPNPVKAVMTFKDNKLSRGDIFLQGDDLSGMKCMEVFQDLVNGLGQTWGKPTDDRLEWHSESTPLQTDEAMAKALEQGVVSWKALWDLNGTWIKLTTGLNDKNKMSLRLTVIGPKMDLPGFMGIAFGTPKDEVTSLEGFKAPEDHGDTLFFEGTWQDQPVALIAFFTNGKFSRLKLMAKNSRGNLAVARPLYREWLGMLKEQYGPPASEGLKWYSESPPLETDEALDKAIENAEVGLQAFWHFGTRTLELRLDLVDNLPAVEIKVKGP